MGKLQVDLVTGFLGVGKTTFIHHYVAYWSRLGKKVRVIENEFGPMDVDSNMLKDDDCELDSLAGMCMCCTGKEAFREMLIGAAGSGCDRVIVEPSGIYDVDEFFIVMRDLRVMECCEIGSVITIVDGSFGNRIQSDCPEETYLLLSQMCASGRILLSKSQLYDEIVLQKTLTGIQALLETYSENTFDSERIWAKDWHDFSDEDFRELSTCGYRQEKHSLEGKTHEGVFDSVLASSCCLDEEDLKSKIEDLMQNGKYGRVLRIKGYVKNPQKQLYEVNAAADVIQIRKTSVKRGLLVVIGQELCEDAIRQRLT